MDEKERTETRDLQTHELYASIGKFIVEFEHICFEMQKAILWMLRDQGLKNQQVVDILLAGYTADPLRTLLESLIGELTTTNDKERKIIKNIFSRIQKITEKRNDVAHSTWFIGWGNATTQDFSEASGHKLHKNKQGEARKSFKYKAENFNDLITEAEKLSSLVMRLYLCITYNYNIGEHFKLNEAGEAICSNE